MKKILAVGSLVCMDCQEIIHRPKPITTEPTVLKKKNLTWWEVQRQRGCQNCGEYHERTTDESVPSQAVVVSTQQGLVIGGLIMLLVIGIFFVSFVIHIFFRVARLS